ncbi:DUF3800 domain-containing protein [Pseudomonas sp. o96-267]|uniref:DUF3800 domain-containing protein n=1 Tax=Pseudomonas sp. o96-267 TaxID=2479853 RepID=UPI0015A801BD|nr:MULTISPECIES: DUF3800 domain-containing protein [Pseudomonas]MDH1620068.1 DUF3800 domain-containing protein [Pseudomonas chengduensis]
MTDKNDQVSISPLPGQLPLFPGSVDTPSVPAERELPEKQFSKYVVYVDESRDHGLESIDPNYPVFVLTFCASTKITMRSVSCPQSTARTDTCICR